MHTFPLPQRFFYPVSDPGNNMLVSSMHFQDAYNMNLERVKRCIVHFGVPMPDGTVLETPFCVMNTFLRDDIEKKVAKVYTQKGKEEWSEHFAGKEMAILRNGAENGG